MAGLNIYVINLLPNAENAIIDTSPNPPVAVWCDTPRIGIS